MAVGIADDSHPVVRDMEARLAEIVLSTTHVVAPGRNTERNGHDFAQKRPLSGTRPTRDFINVGFLCSSVR